MQRLDSSAQANITNLEAASDQALWRLCEIFRDDLEGLRCLIDEYLHDSLKLISKMQHAVHSGQVQPLRAAAHTLKSNALVFGEIALSRLCGSIEATAVSSSKEGMDGLIFKLVSEQDRARVLLIAKYRVLVSALTSRS